jgi:hypothetical protein
MIETLVSEKQDIEIQTNIKMKEHNIKEVLRIAQILACNFDYVPNEVDEAFEFLIEGMGEEVEKDLVQHVVDYYMGYSAYDVDQKIFKEYFGKEYYG